MWDVILVAALDAERGGAKPTLGAEDRIPLGKRLDRSLARRKPSPKPKTAAAAVRG